MTEKELWSKIKNLVPDADWTRIETVVSEGVPDVNGCYLGAEVWLELKIWHGSRVEARSAQIPWHWRRRRAGGRTFVIVGSETGFDVFDGLVLPMSVNKRPVKNKRSVTFEPDRNYLLYSACWSDATGTFVKTLFSKPMVLFKPSMIPY